MTQRAERNVFLPQPSGAYHPSPLLWPGPLLWPVRPEDQLPLLLWRKFLRDVLFGVSLLSILVPLFGPLFNYHYANNTPHHAHIYLGAVDGNHDHPTIARPRAHGGESFAAGGDTFSFTDGVISVPGAADWMPQSSRAPVLLFLALPTIFTPLAASLCGRVALELLLPCDDLFLPPPEKPPRAVTGAS